MALFYFPTAEMIRRIPALGMLVLIATASYAQEIRYPWLSADAGEPGASIKQRWRPPPDCRRSMPPAGSFAGWLQQLPLEEGTGTVLLYTGRPKSVQSHHAAVVAIDVGKKDLQQCADAIIRLRAEYLWSINQRQDIRFDFTSGDTAVFERWCRGYRPRVSGADVRWVRTALPSSGYRTFRSYLQTVFMYAGTVSLARQLTMVPESRPPQIGQVILEPGSPGHAVLIVDQAVHAATGAVYFILAQSYMPAQSVHIIKNPADPGISPWYRWVPGGPLVTPDWRFRTVVRYRF